MLARNSNFPHQLAVLISAGQQLHVKVGPGTLPLVAQPVVKVNDVRLQTTPEFIKDPFELIRA